MNDYLRGEPEPAGPMDGNPYFKPLARFEGGLRPSTLDVAYIQAQATLALAYEQRTANLLHALEIEYRASGFQVGINPDDIAARMGLDK